MASLRVEGRRANGLGGISLERNVHLPSAEFTSAIGGKIVRSNSLSAASKRTSSKSIATVAQPRRGTSWPTSRQDGCSGVPWRDWIAQKNRIVFNRGSRLLADARTERTAAILLDQYGGGLNRAIDGIVAAIESDDTATSTARLDELLSRAAPGFHLVEPWRVVLAGPPNAGKSSLINTLVGYRRSIVHDTPGTTRDAVNFRRPSMVGLSN